jgi:hypothetical protein
VVSPSAILSEVFLQYIEENYTVQMAGNYQLLQHFRYVDDILIIYDQNVTDINSVLQDFNQIRPLLQFAVEFRNKKFVIS